MKFLQHKQFGSNTFKPSRAVFQGVDNAPPSPENFKNNEKQASQADAIAEVAQQSPSQIMGGAVTKGGVIQTKYTKNTKILAKIIDDPLGVVPPAAGNPSDQKPNE